MHLVFDIDNTLCDLTAKVGEFLERPVGPHWGPGWENIPTEDLVQARKQFQLPSFYETLSPLPLAPCPSLLRAFGFKGRITFRTCRPNTDAMEEITRNWLLAQTGLEEVDLELGFRHGTKIKSPNEFLVDDSALEVENAKKVGARALKVKTSTDPDGLDFYQVFRLLKEEIYFL